MINNCICYGDNDGPDMVDGCLLGVMRHKNSRSNMWHRLLLMYAPRHQPLLCPHMVPHHPSSADWHQLGRTLIELSLDNELWSMEAQIWLLFFRVHAVSIKKRRLLIDVVLQALISWLSCLTAYTVLCINPLLFYSVHHVYILHLSLCTLPKLFDMLSWASEIHCANS